MSGRQHLQRPELSPSATALTFLSLITIRTGLLVLFLPDLGQETRS